MGRERGRVWDRTGRCRRCQESRPPSKSSKSSPPPAPLHMSGATSQIDGAGHGAWASAWSSPNVLMKDVFTAAKTEQRAPNLLKLTPPSTVSPP